jgi:hypothetical protein
MTNDENGILLRELLDECDNIMESNRIEIIGKGKIIRKHIGLNLNKKNGRQHPAIPNSLTT